MNIAEQLSTYRTSLEKHLSSLDIKSISKLADALHDCFTSGRQLFVCGNGGSGSNANHIANDLIYGITKTKGVGIKCHSLSANSATLLCLANDEGYENIFSYQLATMASEGDILLALSGSGNSPNIISALNEAKNMNVTSFTILGFDGGKAKSIADNSIHIPINDMQVSEDFQMIILHAISQWLNKKFTSL